MSIRTCFDSDSTRTASSVEKEVKNYHVKRVSCACGDKRYIIGIDETTPSHVVSTLISPVQHLSRSFFLSFLPHRPFVSLTPSLPRVRFYLFFFFFFLSPMKPVLASAADVKRRARVHPANTCRRISRCRKSK